MEPWIKSPLYERIQSGIFPADRRKFPHTQGQQCEYGCSSGQGLAHPLHHQEMLRACQNEPAGTGLRIHHALQIGQQIGKPLDLIQNRAIPQAIQKPARIHGCKGPDIRILQTPVGFFRKDLADKGGFPGLPWSNHRDHRLAGCRPQ